LFFNVLNPGPSATPPYVQPGAVNPTANSGVANFAVGSSPLQVAQPLAQHYEPGSLVAVTGRGPVQGPIPAQLGAGSQQ
jgi:hypothetical protein